jgi:hypothetical protein
MTELPIDLPEGFVPLVVKDYHVHVGQILAKKDAPKDAVVNILESLDVSRSQGRKSLKKSPGDKITPGDVIAVRKSLFGKVQKRVVSQISGIILRYERDTGNLVVRTDQEMASLELISPVAGTVTLCNNKEIVIQTKDAVVSKGAVLGETREGILFVLEASFEPDFDSALYYLDNRVSGKIVLAKKLTRDLITKGNTIGVKGFIGVEILRADIEYLQERDISLPVLEISEELVDQLADWKNKRVMIDTQNKAVILREEE